MAQSYKFKHDGVYIRKYTISYAKEFHTFNHAQTLQYLIKNCQDLISGLEKEKKAIEERLNELNQGSLFE